jgi:hypothetical protein
MPARPPAPQLDAQFGAYAPGAAAELGAGYAPRTNDVRQPPSHDYRRTAQALSSVERARNDIAEATIEFVQAANANTAPALRPRANPVHEAQPSRALTPEGAAAAAEEMPQFLRTATPEAAWREAQRPAVQPAPVAAATPAPSARPEPALPENVIAMPPRTPTVAAPPAAMPPKTIEAPSTAVTGPVEMAVTPHARGIDVTLSRETATFTLRASDPLQSPAVILLPAPQPAEAAAATDDEAANAIAAALIAAVEPHDGQADSHANGHAYAHAGLDQTVERSALN